MNQTHNSGACDLDKNGINMNDENNNNLIIDGDIIDNNNYIESMVCDTLLKEEEEEEEDDEEMDNPNGDIVPLDDEIDSNCDINLNTLITSNNNNNNIISTINPTTTNNNNNTTTSRSHEGEDGNDEPMSNYYLENAACISKREPKLIGNFINHNNHTNNSTTTFTVKSENASFQSNQPTFEQQFANIFDDEEMLEVDFTGEDDLQQQNVGYFCIFCPETFKDRDEARRHYQKHVNYYSMMCSLCGEGATDMQEFVRHHKESHPEAKKGRYKRREQPIIDKWINGFLYAQATITRALPPRDHCPVCEKIFSASQIECARPRKSSLSRKIDHIHRHLCYLPYECVRCKEEGKEYSVAYFESKANNHIKLKHPEVDDSESRWLIFQKTISIGKLDDFIANYLSKFGITMEYERRPTKKVNRELIPGPSNGGANGIATICNSKSSLISINNIRDRHNYINNTQTSMTETLPSINNNNNNNNSNIDIPTTSTTNNSIAPAPANSTSINTTTTTTTSTNNNNSSKSNNDNGVIVLDDDEEDVEDQSLAGNSSVGSEEAVDGNSMIIAVSPSHAEYIESGRTSNKRRHSEEYFCLFCNFKFPCKLDAYPHFGEHLEYKPVLCLLCDNKFPDTDAFTVHHQEKHREATDLMYEIREDQNIERWVDEFLESQLTPLSARLTLNCSCATCCPVCEKLLPRRSLVAAAACDDHNDVSFAEHIHQHLAYNAYECTFCKKLDHSTRLPNLDSAALKHVRENHYVRDATLYQLSRAFPKTLTIAKLERFIAESVQKRRTLYKKWQLYKIEQTKMEKLKLQQQMNAAKLYQQQHQLQYPPQANGFGAFNHENSHNIRNGPFLAAFKNNVNHVRVEGGRVVNLPSPLSIKAIQQRNNSKSNLNPGNSNPHKNNFASQNSGMSSSSSSNNNNHNHHHHYLNHHHPNQHHLHHQQQQQLQHNSPNRHHPQHNNNASSVINLSMKSNPRDKNSNNGNNMNHKSINHNLHTTSSSSSSSNKTNTNNQHNQHNQQHISSSQTNNKVNVNSASSIMMNMMMNLNNLSNLTNMSAANLMKTNTIDLTNDEVMVQTGISTGVRFFVKCLHCNIELPNRKQLKVHHRQAHPGLNMACFTTPKPMFASEVSP